MVPDMVPNTEPFGSWDNGQIGLQKLKPKCESYFILTYAVLVLAQIAVKVAICRFSAVQQIMFKEIRYSFFINKAMTIDQQHITHS